VASDTHAPEGPHDPYLDGEEPGRYGDFGHHDYERDAYASLLTQVEEPSGSYDFFGHSRDVGPARGHEGAWATHEFAASTGEFPVGGYSDAGWPTGEIPAQRPEFGAYEFGDGRVPPVPGAFGPEDGGPKGEWNPTEDSVKPVRGRHKLAKQRGGSMARSGAVLGIGMVAAVGAGGMATAQEKPATSISVSDVTAAAESAKELPGVKSLVGGEEQAGDPLTQGALTADDAKAGRTDAGEALRSRIMAQAQSQQSAAEQNARDAAIEKAAGEAQAKAEKATAKAEAAKRKAAEEARLEKLAKSYKLPVSGYQLTSVFGESGGLWTNGHTGTDFAASSGTQIRAIHSGTVKSAGWAGSYGYRTIIEMDDGTELWFCHQSSMKVSPGQKVRTGEVIGAVGATGNVTGAHLHLEVRPGGGDAIDPAGWLRGKGLSL
jgi:murein DD-endopeptidase MepM/ murein hydrolase activator NlpD